MAIRLMQPVPMPQGEPSEDLLTQASLNSLGANDSADVDQVVVPGQGQTPEDEGVLWAESKGWSSRRAWF